MIEYPWNAFSALLLRQPEWGAKPPLPSAAANDDDYLFRNEDIIFSTLIRNAGQRWGQVDNTFHYTR